jgi:hypothetical protein
VKHKKQRRLTLQMTKILQPYIQNASNYQNMWCSCHLLNLIATTDVNNIYNVTFKKMKKCIDAKLQNIWNKKFRSSLASGYINNTWKFFLFCIRILTGTFLRRCWIRHEANWIKKRRVIRSIFSFQHWTIKQKA